MTAIIMDGRIVAAEAKRRVAGQVRSLKENGIQPHLATVLVGNDAASAAYLKTKHKSCEEVGIFSENHHLPDTTGQGDVEGLVADLNDDHGVHGILVQLPLPAGFDEERVIRRIMPSKDVDGLHPLNAGELAAGAANLVPCTPKGIVQLLSYYKVPLAGSRVVIVNRTNLVGKPLAMLLVGRDATVTICHSKTRNLAEVTRAADVLISAVGRPEFRLGPDHVNPGAAVVDVGLTRIDGKLRGDVDFDAVREVAGFLTPVPGGVGPMTVAMLLENTVQAAETQASREMVSAWA